MMELKEATQRLRMHMELLDSAAMPTKCEVFTVCGHSAGQMRDDLATVLEAISRLSLEGGGEKASCTDSTDAPACGAATSTQCQSEDDWIPCTIDQERPVERNVLVDLRLDHPPNDDGQLIFLGERPDHWIWGAGGCPPVVAWRLHNPAKRRASVAVAEPAQQRAQTGRDRDDQQSQATERLREALTPFAEAMSCYGDDPTEPGDRNCWEHPLAMLVDVRDFRRARAALSAEGGVS